jgi:hypothetical protein
MDQLAQRPGEFVAPRVAREACDDAALRPDQRHDRVVSEGIFIRCLEVTCQAVSAAVLHHPL